MPIISSLHLNTNQAVSYDGQTATFIVNWDKIFQGKKSGYCRVYLSMRSNGSTIQNRTVGYMTGSFVGSNSINNDGVVLANIKNQFVKTNTETLVYQTAQTPPFQAPMIFTPTGQQMFHLKIIPYDQ